MKYIQNLSNDPQYNLAFEEYCFKNLPKDEDYVILWVNGPSIIVGKNQNTLEEVDTEYIKAHDIVVVRRITGGGAVYHDLGNLNFSIIKATGNYDEINFREYNIPILNALKRLNLLGELSGRNDMTIDGKKFSGIAQSIWRHRALNHGTLLFDTQLDVLSKALTVKQDKIESKGIKSVRSRVTNIKDYLADGITIEEFKGLLLKYIFEFAGEEPTEYVLSEDELSGIDALYEEKYSQWDWNYGRAPQFSYKNYKKYPFGGIEVRLDIKKGTIDTCKFYGDFFGSEGVEKLEAHLTGQPYHEEVLLESVSEEALKKYFGAITKEEFRDLLFELAEQPAEPAPAPSAG
ncbi:lipoate--protein ligase [Bradymonas sediminis]|uniref:lipoate--protein ligase n=1 Tax=Bradymonas sediminis TaxID=1548548 RepID=A0A2Z4FIH7_9DELT|nr:lipoate--protein ligase [Bradymonas sediminis]AWV88476.1 lipoate--protein ligase [Bradymonas sediminis]TDP77606.1 lipoate-protein ligase [Bradymonas sediminis]